MTVQRLLFVLATWGISSLILAGCSDKRSSGLVDAQTVGPTNTLSLELTGNSTRTVHVSFPGKTQVSGTVNFDEGPQWAGYSLLFFEEAGRDPTARAELWERSEFARIRKQNSINGQNETICFQSQPAPCKIRDRQSPRHDYPIEFDPKNEFGARGTLLVIAETSSRITMNLSFSNAGYFSFNEIQKHSRQRIPLEVVDADFSDMERCVEIAWCGTIIQGRHSFNVAPGTMAWVTVRAFASPGAFLKLCLEPLRSESDCVEMRQTASFAAGRRSLILGANGPYVGFQVSASSATKYVATSNFFGEALITRFPENIAQQSVAQEGR